jgi:hypothetical protein
MPIWMGITTGLHILVSAIAWLYFKPIFPWLLATALIWAIVVPYLCFVRIVNSVSKQLV